MVTKLPLNGGSNSYVQVEGQAPRSNDNQGPLVEMSFIAGDYFAAAGIDLLAGRTLQPDDLISTALGAVMNETMANRVRPGENALGKRFTAENEAYLPVTESWTPAGYLTLRTRGDAAAIAPAARAAELAVDPSIPPSDVQTMRARVEDAFAQRRFITTLITLFAAAALLLATAGIYRTVAHYVARRTREPGGRMASTRVVARLLYGVAPLDVLTIAAGALALALVTLGASTLPAVRTLNVPPSLALRLE